VRLALFAEFLFLVRRLHHEEGRSFKMLGIEILHPCNYLQPVEIRHVEVDDQQSKRPVTLIVALLEVHSDLIHSLLPVSHVGHIAFVNIEDLLKQCLHGDDHELHVVGHEDLSRVIFNCQEIVFLSLCLIDGSLLRSKLRHHFVDWSRQPPHIVLSEARYFNFFAVRHLTLQREAEGAAKINLCFDPDGAA